ncbi:MAG: cytochrome c oxidase subunit II [Candidatus Roizmanbacteria bacterium GW2011_GWA2_35_19]|uniref:Cytochrome c oxidase subunit II n=2 Tax=Candidatus Roizmaniibacteriota TaxID=1752723 RepID=A0A0G0BQP2_9BACT|nr:MAG: cytochrome c oxidase subunit II [Candidatus Roizmanbacteria bacterium GW2011_GWC2_35_12]KKP71708.1 MAG: cytochrome c oxidase subunit II [Candidatus Roizmanbacteria bacterium GW2011_GWA2_35_19]
MKNLILGVVFIVMGFWGWSYFNSQVANPSANSKTTILTTESESDKVKEFTMIAKQWSFDPALIKVKQGDKVRLKITSVDVSHGIAIPDFDVKADLKPNVETTVDFTADKKGEFTFFCSVLCGQGHTEMSGKLIVE